MQPIKCLHCDGLMELNAWSNGYHCYACGTAGPRADPDGAKIRAIAERMKPAAKVRTWESSTGGVWWRQYGDNPIEVSTDNVRWEPSIYTSAEEMSTSITPIIETTPGAQPETKPTMPVDLTQCRVVGEK